MQTLIIKYFEKIKEFFNNLRNNKFFLIFLLLLVFIYLINNDFFLQRFDKNYSIENNKIIQLNEKVKKMQKNYSSISTERFELLNTKKYIKKLTLTLKQNKSSLPDTFHIADLVKQISDCMPETNFEIKYIKFNKIIKSKKINYKILPISISIVSGYNQALLFLKKINSLKRIILIQNMKISADQKIPSELEINLTAETFALKKN
jgi:Tfp pilus assembly protein PilO